MTTDDITHIVVGFGESLITELDLLLPPRSVLLLEEPDVALATDAEQRFLRHRCAGGIAHAPTQDESNAESLGVIVGRPAAVVAAIPALEYGVVAAAGLAEAWGLPGAGLRAARILRDKGLLREAADRAGLTQPDWRWARDAQDVADFGAAHDGWCVLKPSGRQASLGVQVLAPGADPVAAWAETVAAEEPVLRSTRSNQTGYIVEQRLHGPEVSVEALVADGRIVFRNVTAKTILSGRRPVELGHTVPAPITTAVAERLDASMTTLVAATGFRSGALHAEWILVNGKDPHLVECAGRLAGDGIPTLVDLAYGGSLAGDFLAVLEGRPTQLDRGRAPRRGASVRFFTAAAGTVRSVTGIEQAKALSGVLQVELTAAVGNRLKPLTSSWERSGLVIAIGADGSESAGRADAAVAAVTIESGEHSC